jgi:fumarate reductase subunit C
VLREATKIPTIFLVSIVIVEGIHNVINSPLPSELVLNNLQLIVHNPLVILQLIVQIQWLGQQFF